MSGQWTRPARPGYLGIGIEHAKNSHNLATETTVVLNHLSGACQLTQLAAELSPGGAAVASDDRWPISVSAVGIPPASSAW